VSAPHAVEALLRRRAAGERGDGARLALAIEGGGMRGAVSAGMAIALDELGLTDAFDAVYGASAGALNGVWLLSGNPSDGLRPYADPALIRQYIRRSNALRGRPVVDTAHLADHLYEHVLPLRYARPRAALPAPAAGSGSPSSPSRGLDRVVAAEHVARVEPRLDAGEPGVVVAERIAHALAALVAEEVEVGAARAVGRHQLAEAA